MDRRQFLRLAGGTTLLTAAGVGCGSGPDEKERDPGAAEGRGRRTLRIAQSAHFVPAFDIWFDDYARRWGEEHDVVVEVDHVRITDLLTQADAQAAAQRGHDMSAFHSAGAAVFEDEVIDLRDIVTDLESKVGRLIPAVERNIRNHRTGKYFAFSDCWAAQLTNYRIDLWKAIDAVPDTWDDVLRAAPRLKATGTPLGVGLSPGLDSGHHAFGLLAAYGASVQDEEGNVVLNRPGTIDAVKTATEVFRKGMTEEVFTWDDAAADNRFLASGKGSFILDPLGTLRGIELQEPQLAETIGLRPPPAGSAGRLFPHSVHTYVIWKFSQNQELAKQFLVDLTLGYKDAVLQSQFYNLPSFPGSVTDLPALLAADPTAKPVGKYGILAEAATWSVNIGHPGDTNAAVTEVFNQFLVANMFVAAARGEMTAEASVAAAEAQIKAIFEKWRGRGKI
ncbi:MAG TPA: extracellular solute-binding protein [Acidimicrobiia bacterium]